VRIRKVNNDPHGACGGRRPPSVYQVWTLEDMARDVCQH